MKRTIYYITLIMAVLTVSGCQNMFSDLRNDSPYKGSLCSFDVSLSYPEGYDQYLREGVAVTVKDNSTGNSYTASTDSNGKVKMELSAGLYYVSVSDRVETANETLLFNSSVDNIKVTAQSSASATVRLEVSKPARLLFKEIYCGGCTMAPESGTYQYDKYLIIYNNSEITLYLDNYCFGTLEPYNSTGSNVWTSVDPTTGETLFRDYLPIAQCVWSFGGNGTTYPLEKGEQAVVSLCGAVDHHAKYPESINLNNSDYFVCYDNIYFTNASYHPTPGNLIKRSNYLNVAVKTGIANAYTFSISSPTAVLFKVDETYGSAATYFASALSRVTKPGSSEVCVKVPVEWVEDAVEVYSGSSANNTKRLCTALDSGYAVLTKTFLRHTLYRNVDRQATEAIEGNTIIYDYRFGADPSGIDAEATLNAGGRIKYADTNNSLNDFHERSIQSLHPESLNR